MKHLMTLTLLSLSMVAAFSCTDPVTPTDKPGENENTITLAADATTITMNADNQKETAITLTWNAASNMGTGARITYSLLFDKAGQNFASAYEMTLGTNITSKELTALEFNEILTDNFDCKADDVMDMEICVYAMINDDSVEDVVSNSVSVKFTVFTPAIETLYMIGSATAAGWELTSAIPMSQIANEDGGFTWSGELLAGELKFLVNTKDWIPCYGRQDDTTLYFRESLYTDETETVETPDNKFIIETEGNYKITLNINTLAIEILQTEGPEYFSMYLAGDLFSEPATMMRSGYVFFGGGVIPAAEGNNNFYFIEHTEDTEGAFFAATENAPFTDKEVSKTSGFSWQLTADQCGKPYKMNLYTKAENEIMYCTEYTPFDTIFLIGSATSAGWEIEKALPMTKGDNSVQSWMGQLVEGEVKFTCDHQSDWYGAWYLASKASATPTGEPEQMYYLDKSAAETTQMGLKEFDQKWVISAEAAGNYQITLDQINQLVTIKKL